MKKVWIWLVAAALYAAFLGWYENWRGALQPAEVAAFTAQLEARALGDAASRANLRRFMEADDGEEFAMLNLVRLAPAPPPHPATGAPTEAAELLREYLGEFLPELAKRAGHPLWNARKVGPYVDAWNVAPDPGWSFAGSVRYRSRRDLMELIVMPEFDGMHAFKTAALTHTFAFPMQPGSSLVAGPRVWLALLLALCAALVHLCALAFARRSGGAR